MTARSPERSLGGPWRIGHGASLAWGTGGGADATARCLLMAIVNVTPDSFSDGGDHATPGAAVDHALRCAAQGAAIIDVGGESTRPGAARVPEAAQVARVVPVVERLARELPPGVVLSVDTTRAAVARAAFDAGAAIINDVSGGMDDPAMLPLAARLGCGIVLMHRLCEPALDSYSDRYAAAPQYGDVVGAVAAALAARMDAAVDAGIARASIAVDPGLGFGKTVAQNFELMDRLGEIAALGAPVVVSASRKSFLGARAGEPDPRRRDGASVEAALHMRSRGAAIVRVHDVAAHAAALLQ